MIPPPPPPKKRAFKIKIFILEDSRRSATSPMKRHHSRFQEDFAEVFKLNLPDG